MTGERRCAGGEGTGDRDSVKLQLTLTNIDGNGSKSGPTFLSARWSLFLFFFLFFCFTRNVAILRNIVQSLFRASATQSQEGARGGRHRNEIFYARLPEIVEIIEDVRHTRIYLTPLVLDDFPYELTEVIRFSTRGAPDA